MPPLSLRVVARAFDRILDPRDATRNAAAAAYELRLRTSGWQDVTAPQAPAGGPAADQRQRLGG